MLAAAGLLDGLPAATHWGAYDRLAGLGAVAAKDRVVPLWDRRIVTAAGVSSGIDMALTVIAHLVDDVAAMAAQLDTEYDPQPPFDSGSLAKAGPAVLERAREYSPARTVGLQALGVEVSASEAVAAPRHCRRGRRRTRTVPNPDPGPRSPARRAR